MNRRDDRVEPLFATNFSERDRSHCLRAIEEKFVASKGASLSACVHAQAGEGATAFMNNSGYISFTLPAAHGAKKHAITPDSAQHARIGDRLQYEKLKKNRER